LDRLDVLESLPGILGRLSSLDRVTWVRLLRSLQGIRDEIGLKLGIRGLGHKDEDVRLAACDLVESFSDWRATSHLTKQLSSDSSPVVRARAAKVLGRLGDRRAAEPLADLLVDPDPRVVAEAAAALGLLGHTPSADRLLDLVDHADPDVRITALTAIGRIGITPSS
jgi:HEAT repeat protein